MDNKLQRKMVAVLRKRELHAVDPNDEEGWAPVKALAKYLKRPEQEILAVVAAAWRDSDVEFYFKRAVGSDGQVWISCIPNRRESAQASHMTPRSAAIPVQDSDDDWGDEWVKREVKGEEDAEASAKKEGDDGDDDEWGDDADVAHAVEHVHAFAESRLAGQRLQHDPEEADMEDMAASTAVVVDNLMTGFMEQSEKMQELQTEVEAAAETKRVMHDLQRQVQELQESAAKRQREMEYDVEGAAMLEAMERRQAEQRAVPPPPQMWQPQPQMCAAPPPQPWQPQRQQPQRQPLRPGLYSGSSLSGSLCGRVSIGSTARPARPSAPPPPPSTPPPPSILMELGMKQWRGY